MVRFTITNVIITCPKNNLKRASKPSPNDLPAPLSLTYCNRNDVLF